MAAADRHLLFGLLALQTGIINQGQLVAAFQAWTLDKGRSLADHLQARGDLTDAEANAAGRASRGSPGNARRRCPRRAWPPSRRADPPAGPGRARRARRSRPRSSASPAARMATPPSPTMMTPSTQRPTPSARPRLTASGSASCGPCGGGLGAVFVALDAELHREVALKQILEKHADDAVSRQRFLIEAEITGGLEHPVSSPSTAWAPMPAAVLTTRCGSSRETRSRT